MGDFVGLGVIGGSGLYDLPDFVTGRLRRSRNALWHAFRAKLSLAHSGNRIAFLSRHGPGHRLSPSEVPYAANIYALKSLGVERLLSVSAVGSLRESIATAKFLHTGQSYRPNHRAARNIFWRRHDGTRFYGRSFCPCFPRSVAKPLSHRRTCHQHRRHLCLH